MKRKVEDRNEQSAHDQREMRSVKLLLVDDFDEMIPDLTEHGIDLEVVYQEGTLCTMQVYDVTVDVLNTIKRLTEATEVGLVVIGNNRGAGVEKARMVAHAMRDNTLIVWNYYEKGDEIPYANLGFKWFTSRDQMGEWITNFLVKSETKVC